jgi:hypothetical protein
MWHFLKNQLCQQLLNHFWRESPCRQRVDMRQVLHRASLNDALRVLSQVYSLQLVVVYEAVVLWGFTSPRRRVWCLVGYAVCNLVEVYCLHHEDECSKHLWNVDKRLPDYTAQHPRRQSSWHLSCVHICVHVPIQISSYSNKFLSAVTKCHLTRIKCQDLSQKLHVLHYLKGTRSCYYVIRRWN